MKNLFSPFYLTIVSAIFFLAFLILAAGLGFYGVAARGSEAATFWLAWAVTCAILMIPAGGAAMYCAEREL